MNRKGRQVRLIAPLPQDAPIAYHVVGFVARHGVCVHDVLAVVEAGRGALVRGRIVLTTCNHIGVFP